MSALSKTRQTVVTLVPLGITATRFSAQPFHLAAGCPQRLGVGDAPIGFELLLHSLHAFTNVLT